VEEEMEEIAAPGKRNGGVRRRGGNDDLRGRNLLQFDRDAAVEADGRRQKCVLGLGLTLRRMISLKPRPLDTLLLTTRRRFAVAGIERC
jgi:hypothetical protein